MPEVAALDLIGTIIAGALTVMVLSYVLGDNVLFRVAVHLFIGVAAGYAGALALRNILWPRLVLPLLSGGLAALNNSMIISWFLVLMLVLKLSPGTARWGSLPLALMVGVGAALVVGGAVTGTLVPQSLAAIDTLDPSAVTPVTGETGAERVVNVLVLLLGTLSTLIYFRFSARRLPSGEAARSRWMTIVAWVGRGFIAITFGVMYAGALAAALTVLADRVQFLIGIFAGLLGS